MRRADRDTSSRTARDSSKTMPPRRLVLPLKSAAQLKGGVRQQLHPRHVDYESPLEVIKLLEERAGGGRVRTSGKVNTSRVQHSVGNWGALRWPREGTAVDVPIGTLR